MERKYYSLTPAQQVVLLQCKFSLFKRVVNILTSMSFDDSVDWNVMEEAFNQVVERNDCLRLRFEKHGKEIKQYFVEHDTFRNISRLSFKSKEEFDSFVLRNRKAAIPYLRGKVIQPFFIDNYDGKHLVYFKVCHLVLDMYGINVIFNDLYGVYSALKNNSDFPEKPGNFETLIQKDLKYTSNPEIHKKNKDFLLSCLESREMPCYAGVHGNDSEIWNKEREKGAKAKKISIVHNDTVGERFELDKSIAEKAIHRAQTTGESLSVIMNYCYAITAGLLNNCPENMLSLEICNCRGTFAEKKTGGTKAQSSASFDCVDWEKSFTENFAAFSEQHNEMYKHVGFSDIEFEQLCHETYKDYKVLTMLYNYCYSFVPFSMPKDISFDFYSNGKGALFCYAIQMWNTDTNSISVAYDYQYRLIKPEVMKKFHELYERVIDTVLDSPDAPLKTLVERMNK